MNKIQEKLISGGYCDERGACTCANVSLLPNGSYGYVLLCVKGGELDIYDVDMHTNPGRLLKRIPLSGVENLRVRGLFIKKLLFRYDGFDYSFGSLTGVGPTLDVIKAESEKRS